MHINGQNTRIILKTASLGLLTDRISRKKLSNVALALLPYEPKYRTVSIRGSLEKIMKKWLSNFKRKFSLIEVKPILFKKFILNKINILFTY